MKIPNLIELKLKLLSNQWNLIKIKIILRLKKRESKKGRKRTGLKRLFKKRISPIKAKLIIKRTKIKFIL